MAAVEKRGWLFGPLPDLLLGCGMLYLLFAPVLWVVGPALYSSQPLWLLPCVLMIFSGSHYGGTLLRVYEDQRERRAYKFFTVYATLLVVGALVAALYYPFAGSLLITLYLTWSPWHYTGQNYGISVMFLRRRDVPVSAAAKRWLYASFVLSYALVVLGTHFDGGVLANDALGYTSISSRGYRFLPLRLPELAGRVLFPIVLIAYATSILTSCALLLRSGSLRAVAPSLALIATQAVWFSIPHAILFIDLSSTIRAFDLRDSNTYTQFYFAWIALGHAIQYLWITSYYARAERRWRGYGRYFLKVFVVGNAAWAAPVFLFGPQLLGRPDYDNGLALSVAAAVNLHHFILDGAIWKLRNSRIAGILIRSQPTEPQDEPLPAGPSWRRRMTWAAVTVFGASMVVGFIEIHHRFPKALARQQFESAEAILYRAALYGRDTGMLEGRLANGLVRAKDPVGAEPHYWLSLQLAPQVDGYLQLGRLYERHENDPAAIATWQHGIREFPNNVILLRQVGEKLLETGSPDRALLYLERAAAIRPDDPEIEAALERAQRSNES
jgi:tetratricopeptide (TPR) repeat protein